MSTTEKWIVFVGGTFCGHEHDYSMLKSEFPSDQAWFEHLHVLLDSGYQGILTDYTGDHIDIPNKKPRKSKKNPVTALTDEQKAHNQTLSRLRIFIENAIAGIKRLSILVHPFRNRKQNLRDDVIALGAALWNLLLL